MKKLNENTKKYIQSQIPRMSKDIHEGFLRNAVSAVANRLGQAKDFISQSASDLKQRTAAIVGPEWQRQSQASVLRQLTRLKTYERSQLISEYAKRTNLSVGELDRLRYDIHPLHPNDPRHPDGGPPQMTIKDSSGNSIPNPHYQDQVNEHKRKIEDWQRRQSMLAKIAGINHLDKRLGAIHRDLYGDFILGSPTGSPPTGHSWSGGRIKQLKSQLTSIP